VNAYRCSCFALTELRRWLAGDCEQFKAAKAHDPCERHFPELPAALFGLRSYRALPAYRPVGVLAGPNGAANSAGVAAQRYGFASGSSRTLTSFRILREVQR
jgi:hypothetical protein